MTARRSESFRMELLDSNNETVGELNPELGASIVVQTGATVGRTLAGVTLHEADAMLDLRASRLRPWMTVDGTEYPLGIYIPTVTALHRLASGDIREAQAHDQSFLLTRTHRVAFGAEVGSSVADALGDLAILAGVTAYEIEDTSVVLGTDLAWAPGSTVATAMAALCRVAGLTTPWFDVTGTMRAIPLPYVGADKPRRAWGPGTASEIADGITEVDDLWNRANEWLAIGKAADVNLAGRFALPDSHPLSVANGAIPVLRTIDVPGVASTAECRDRARDAAQRDGRVHRVREFNCRTDPTLEQHDIVTYDGEDYLLASFTIPLQTGVDQHVTLRESLVVGEGV